MKILIILGSYIFLFTSCQDQAKKLDEKKISANDIIISWYRISAITTIHDFVDITRWGHTKNIMKANTDGIYEILIKGDTVIIRTTQDLLVYELAAKTLNCYIQQDSSVSTYDYLLKYNPASAPAFKSK